MTQKEFDELIEKAKVLRAKKNADYGNSFMQSYNRTLDGRYIGNTCIIYDIERKSTRLNNILWRELFDGTQTIKVSDETLEDTLVDLSIICLNAAIALKARKK